MSPRCSERPTLQNNFQMYGAVCKVFLDLLGLESFWMWGGVYINMVYCMWCGVVWSGVVWCGVVWCGTSRWDQ